MPWGCCSRPKLLISSCTNRIKTPWNRVPKLMVAPFAPAVLSETLGFKFQAGWALWPLPGSKISCDERWGGKGTSPGAGGGSPWNKWFPVNSSVPFPEVSEVLWAGTSCPAAHVYVRYFSEALPLARPSLVFSISVVVVVPPLCPVYFFKVLRRRKVFNLIVPKPISHQ